MEIQNLASNMMFHVDIKLVYFIYILLLFLLIQESQFLTSLGLSRQSLEPKANLCSKVFVWHTRTEKSKFESTDLIRIKNYKTSQFSSVEKESLGLNSAERENEF